MYVVFSSIICKCQYCTRNNRMDSNRPVTVTKSATRLGSAFKMDGLHTGEAQIVGNTNNNNNNNNVATNLTMSVEDNNQQQSTPGLEAAAEKSSGIPAVENGEEELVKKLRPLSRRGAKEIQKETMTVDPVARPQSQASGSTSNARPPTGIGNRLQGTASRLASSARSQQSSASLSLSVLPSRPDTQANTTDRLVTQQGLSRARNMTTAGRRGPGGTRLIQDKRYYEGLLQVKMREIYEEIRRLRKEIEDTNKERSTFLIYDKQVKQLATELTELQGKLADYNLCLDKINTGTDTKDVEAEYRTLKASNETEQMKLESVFAERTQVEQQVQTLEREIEKEKRTTENLISEMTSEMKQKYSNLLDSNNLLQETVNRLQRELNDIAEERENLLSKLTDSPAKLEVAKLQLKILELEDEKEALESTSENAITDDSGGGVVNNGRGGNYSSSQVKEDKAEIASMERAMNKLKEEIQHMQKEIENLDRDIKECHSDRYQKYLELRKREETIVGFLSTYEENKKRELERMAEVKTDIVKSLFALSKHLLTMPAATTQTEYELVNKELPQIDSTRIGTSSSELLKLQYQQRQMYYKKLEAMETKLKDEIVHLEKQKNVMRTELETYSDLDGLREKMEAKKTELSNKKRALLEMKEVNEQRYKSAEQEYNEAKKKLKENETYTQLQALERKLAQSEQNNFAIREFVADKKCEIDYDEIKEEALAVVKEYNKMLIDKYATML